MLRMQIKLPSLLFFAIIVVQGVWTSSKPEKCLLDFDTGSDSENWTKSYGFNKTAGLCEPFWYGGSGGNDNTFPTLDDCISACDSDEEAPQSVFFSSEICSLKFDEGRYENWTMYYGYNQDTKECEGFYYGGRGGNQNRFETLEKCIDFCEPINEELVLSSHTKEDCLLDIDNGEDGSWKEFYAFVKSDNKCVPFFYGGSGGNGNRFNTEKECRWFCKQVSETRKLLEQAGSDLYNWFSFFSEMEDYICAYGSCLETQNNIRAIIHSGLFETYYKVSPEVLIKISIAIDNIVNEENILQKSMNMTEIIENVTKALARVLENVNRFGDFINDEHEPPALINKMYEKMEAVKKYVTINSLKKILLNTILEEKGSIDENINNKISQSINEVFMQYNDSFVQDYTFNIAHDVDYYVKKYFAK